MRSTSLLALGLSVCSHVLAQSGDSCSEEPFNITSFPKEQYGNVSRYLLEARDVAGQDIYPHFAHRCIYNQVQPTLANLGQSPGYIRPASPFKGLFFVGQSAWSAWAIDTGEGLILVDTLNSAEEAETMIIPGLEAFGYAGGDISHIFITHEHGDHYNGARWLQEQFDPIVMASEVAWEAMVEDGDGPIRNDKAKVVGDGEHFTLGNTTLTFYLTPGHTPGATSMIFNVTDAGTEMQHTAGFFGGMGIPRNVSDKVDQMQSLLRFRDLGEEAGADTLLANHQLQDRSLFHFDILDHRSCKDGKCDTGNPFVIGVDALVRYWEVQELCIRVSAARNGQNLPI